MPQPIAPNDGVRFLPRWEIGGVTRVDAFDFAMEATRVGDGFRLDITR
jgi:hypothetical protein